VIDARSLALESLIRILEKDVFSTEEIAETYRQHPDLSKEERALYTRIVEGTTEKVITIDYYLNAVSNTKTDKMKAIIRSILRMSAYQILFLDRIPDHAVCNEAVKLTEKSPYRQLKGFVNGVLRGLIREKDQITFPDPDKKGAEYLSIAYSFPQWLTKMWIRRYGFEETEKMLKAFSGEKKICLRVNQKKTTRDNLKKALAEEDVKAENHPYLENALLVEKLDRVEKLLAFRNGWFYVQDTSSILGVALAGIKEDMQILDVCAAPGGKSLYAADLLKGSGQVIARDLSKEKVGKIQENAKRMGYVNLKTEVQDACEKREEDIEKYDLVIADLPCSGLGVLGRKSDIRYRITPAQMHELSLLQRQILDVVSCYVKPGGLLLYSTCTISIEENERNAAYIKESLPFEALPLEGVPQALDEENSKEGMLQLFPHKGIYHDGFFISLFRKNGEIS
jgi:16S rRNA (cytosine967-C5)-methyltransferase